MSVAWSSALNKYAPKNPTANPQYTKIWKRSTEQPNRFVVSGERTPTPDSGALPIEPAKDATPDRKMSDYAQYRQHYVEEKAANVEMPSEDEAKLEPKYLFGDQVMVIHMCAECRAASRRLKIVELEDGNQGLVISLCPICRAHLNTQRRMKFFKHELPCTKRRQTLRNQ